MLRVIAATFTIIPWWALSVQMHLEGIVALLNSEMKTLFVETLKRLHGEVCLDEIYSLFSSIQFNNGTIGKDSKIILNPHHQSFDNGTRWRFFNVIWSVCMKSFIEKSWKRYQIAKIRWSSASTGRFKMKKGRSWAIYQFKPHFKFLLTW